MFVQNFLRAVLNDSEYDDIQYDTLRILHVLPFVIDDCISLQMAFALTGYAKPTDEPLVIDPPFCRCYMKSTDMKLVWEEDDKRYSGKSNQDDSIIHLTKEVLKEQYIDPLNFSDYSSYLEFLDGLDYFQLLKLIVDRALINKEQLAEEDKKKIRDILFFFNGVPETLVCYYNQEGKFLADWLRANCL
jgi:hypothetical protein